MTSLDNFESAEKNIINWGNAIEELNFNPAFEITSADQVDVPESVREAVSHEYNQMVHEIDAMAMREIASRNRAKKSAESMDGVWIKLFAPDLMRGITAAIPIGDHVLVVKNGIIVGWE